MKGHYLVMTCRRIKKNIWSRDRVSFLHFSGRGVGNTENKRTNRSELLLFFYCHFIKSAKGSQRCQRPPSNSEITVIHFALLRVFGSSATNNNIRCRDV